MVLNIDGTVSKVSSTFGRQLTLGSESNFSSNTDNISIAFDPIVSNRVVVAYRNNTYGTAVVGTITGTTITFGTPIVFYSNYTDHISVAFDPHTSGKIVVAFLYSSGGAGGMTKIGSISGTSITFYSQNIFEPSTYAAEVSVGFDKINSNRIVIAYRHASVGKARVGIISGNSMTFGASVQYSTDMYNTEISFDPNTAGKFLLSYYLDYGDDTKLVVGTISGTSLTFGSAHSIAGIDKEAEISIEYDPFVANRFVFAYVPNSGLRRGTASAGMVSGSSITFYAPIEFGIDNTFSISMAFDQNIANKVSFIYSCTSPSISAVREGTLSGSSITLSDDVHSYNVGYSTRSILVYDQHNAEKIVVIHTSGSSGNAVVGIFEDVTATNLDETNFIGMSQDHYQDAQDATIKIQGGLLTNQSGLTPLSTYYVQEDGTLGTSPDTINVIAGKALSSTKLLLKSY